MADATKAAGKPEPSKHELAKELLELTVKIAPETSRIDDLKGKLKFLAEGSGGFTERVDGLGKVEVKAPADGRFTGTMYELVPETYIALPDQERAKLVATGLVKDVHQFSRPFGGSVSAKPA